MAYEWYKRGEEFLDEANSALQKKRYWFACFNAHQAAEFYLKGKLIELCGSFSFTHDLSLLCKELTSCLNIGLPNEILLAAQFLSPHYTSSRYPGLRGINYDESLAKTCIDMATKIIKWVEGL